MTKFFIRIWRMIFGRHQWTYRNPASRCCRRCGRHEVYFRNLVEPDGWDQVYPDPHSPEKCE